MTISWKERWFVICITWRQWGVWHSQCVGEFLFCSTVHLACTLCRLLSCFQSVLRSVISVTLTCRHQLTRSNSSRSENKSWFSVNFSNLAKILKLFKIVMNLKMHQEKQRREEDVWQSAEFLLSYYCFDYISDHIRAQFKLNQQESNGCFVFHRTNRCLNTEELSEINTKYLQKNTSKMRKDKFLGRLIDQIKSQIHDCLLSILCSHASL